MNITKRKTRITFSLLTILLSGFFISCEKNETLVKQDPDQEAHAKDTALASEDYNENGNLKFSGSDLPPPVPTANQWVEYKSVNNGTVWIIINVKFLQHLHYYYDMYGQEQTYIKTDFYYTVNTLLWTYEPLLQNFMWTSAACDIEVQYNYWGENISPANNTITHFNTSSATKRFLSDFITYSNHPAVQHMDMSVTAEGLEVTIEVNN